jgi:hypothetical protein
MNKTAKRRALCSDYVSPKQMILAGFETPFEKSLDKNNRWVVLSHLIPWDDICSIYFKMAKISETGRPPLNPRIILGSLIIKHLCNLDDRETVSMISENVYMQYFLGYSSFTGEPPFDASLFVEIRKRLGQDTVNQINERIGQLKAQMEQPSGDDKGEDENDKSQQATKNKGKLIVDATACPQDIAYPTDLNLLNDAREKSEQLIDLLYNSALHKKKPRTYRKIARKEYLKTAQKKNKTTKEIRRAVGSQLGYLKRNLSSINSLLDTYPSIPLKPLEYKYLLVITTLLDQQKQMYETKTHTVEYRIVSIHQPHVRPIVRGKTQAKVEFGAKIHVSLVDGISYLDELSWDAFNEGSRLARYIEKYNQRFGFYPKEVLADKIYCTRENRAFLKEKGIKLLAKPLGRPPAVQNHVSPGERNPIEGKFGQAKTGYGLNRIKARLQGTSETWIASIILVLNLVKLAGVALLCLIASVRVSFSAWYTKVLTVFLDYNEIQNLKLNHIHTSSHWVTNKIAA